MNVFAILTLVALLSSPMPVQAKEIQNSELTCLEGECEINESEISFKSYKIISQNILIADPIKRREIGQSNFTKITIFQGDTTVWSYRSFLDPSGRENVGMTSTSVAPDGKSLALLVVGNYEEKIILLSDNGKVWVFNGGFYTWENKGKYIFSRIHEEMPVGFVIINSHSGEMIFESNLLINEWKHLSGNKYLLSIDSEAGGSSKSHTRDCFILKVGSSKVKISKGDCEKDCKKL